MIRKVLSLLLAFCFAFFCPVLACAMDDEQNNLEDKVYRDGEYEYRIKEDGGAEITRYLGSEKIIDIPAKLGGYPVTSIGEAAFFHCIELRKVTVPGSVRTIGSGAFAYCYYLTIITLSEGLGEIGEYAFNQCSIINISIPESVKCIKSYAFVASALTEVVIPKTVEELGDGIFFGCSELKSVKILCPLPELPSGMFAFCGKLTDISIHSLNGRIGSEAFKYCTSLQRFEIPEGTTELETNVFLYCFGLEEIVIPASVKEFYTYDETTENGEILEYNPFTGCSSELVFSVAKDSAGEDFCESHQFRYRYLK